MKLFCAWIRVYGEAWQKLSRCKPWNDKTRYVQNPIHYTQTPAFDVFLLLLLFRSTSATISIVAIIVYKNVYASWKVDNGDKEIITFAMKETVNGLWKRTKWLSQEFLLLYAKKSRINRLKKTLSLMPHKFGVKKSFRFNWYHTLMLMMTGCHWNTSYGNLFPQ